MKIWIINNYTVMPQYGALTRSYQFAKHLAEKGHEVTVFAGSHVHNTEIQLITGKEKFRLEPDCPFPWVHIKTLTYGSSRKKQVLSMFQFCMNLRHAIKKMEKPDVIIGSSSHPLAAAMGLCLSRKYGCRGVAEIRDLWPESIVVYDVAQKANIAIKLLYCLEKWIYKKADAIVFTMEGGRDYIVGKKWDTGNGGPVDLSKVYHINNGVDLEEFDDSRDVCVVPDEDLDNPELFKVVYTGSIRKVNGVDKLVESAKCLQEYPNIRLLVFGAGTELEALKQSTRDHGLTNIVFKGVVPKKQIPSILCRSDLCLLHWNSTPIIRYGMSMNKTFEYMAAGKPILSTNPTPYSVLKKYQCGIETEENTPEEIAKGILQVYRMPEEEYARYCKNARTASEDFDFERLTERLIEAITGGK